MPDAAAEWAGSALGDLFPDGLLLVPSSGGVTRLKGWLAPGASARRQAAALARLRSIGASGLRSRLERPRPPAAPHGRFPVQSLGRFRIVPASRLSQLPPARSGERRIALVQGQAFGTGLHESTRLMLGQLERLAAEGAAGPGALDVGAGSGILGFALLHLGAASVTCVELESAACAELRENRALNGVAPRALPVLCGRYPLRRLRARRYPLLLANLVTPLLLELMPALARQLAPGGRLLLSGIHGAPEARAVAAAARRAGLRPQARASLRGWWVLRFARP